MHLTLTACGRLIRQACLPACLLHTLLKLLMGNHSTPLAVHCCMPHSSHDSLHSAAALASKIRTAHVQLSRALVHQVSEHTHHGCWPGSSGGHGSRTSGPWPSGSTGRHSTCSASAGRAHRHQHHGEMQNMQRPLSWMDKSRACLQVVDRTAGSLMQHLG